jgi:hypothetical protein
MVRLEGTASWSLELAPKTKAPGEAPTRQSESPTAVQKNA